MAAKNIDEVVLNVMTTATMGMDTALKNELQDYLSHEVIRLEAELLRIGMSEEQRQFANEILTRFFKRVMNK